MVITLPNNERPLVGAFNFSGGEGGILAPPSASRRLLRDISAKYGNLNGIDDRRPATSDSTGPWAEINPLCAQRKQPDMRNFPYIHMP
jgi:hypothetical protein